MCLVFQNPEIDISGEHTVPLSGLIQKISALMTMPAKTIDEVLTELDLIIDETVAENNFIGIFAYVYRRTTAQVKQAILEKQFEDNIRMEALDVAFANLYLTAYQQYTSGLLCSTSWLTAFSAKNERITIIQHLLLGMNAHINLDLGIAAATIAPGASLPALKADFMKVNQLLGELVNEMQGRVAKVSRLMFLLDWAGKNTDELIVSFSMAKSREQSWNLACVLAQLAETDRKPIIEVADRTITALGTTLKCPPGKSLKMLLKLIAFFEEKNSGTIIGKLREDHA